MSQVQEVYQVLTEIDKLLADIELKIQNIERGGAGHSPIREVHSSVSQVLRLTMRLSHLFAHMGFPPEVQGVVNKLNQIVFTARAAYAAMMLLQSTTVYGQIMGVIGIATVAVSMGSGSILEGY